MSALLLLVLGACTDERPSPQPRPYPEQVVAVYHMMWPESESPPLASTPPDVNVVNLAFAQGDPLQLPGWSQEGREEFLSAVHELRSRGTRIVLSVGGEGGWVDVADRQSFVDAVMEINSEIPLDGLDWDVEGDVPMDADDVLWISRELRRLRGDDFAITMAPNGANVDEYLPMAVALHESGDLSAFGQQFYDTEITPQQVSQRIRQAVDAGLPAHKLLLGTKVGEDARALSVESWVSLFERIRREHPELAGAYLWESGRPRSDDWVDLMSAEILS